MSATCRADEEEHAVDEAEGTRRLPELAHAIPGSDIERAEVDAAADGEGGPESEGHGSGHHALVEFRRVDKDESLDFVPLTIWTLTGLSIFLFWMTLVISDAPVVNWFMAAPVLLFVYFGHRDFANAKRAEELEAIWEKVRTRLVPPAASSEQPIPAQPAGGEAERPGSPQGGDNS